MIVDLFPIKEEKRLVAPIVNARQIDGTGQREAVLVAALPPLGHPVAVVGPTVGIQLVVAQIVVHAAMDLIGAGPSGSHRDTAGGAAIFGGEAIGDKADFLDGFLRRRVGVVECGIVAGILAVEEDGVGMGASATDDGAGAGVPVAMTPGDRVSSE